MSSTDPGPQMVKDSDIQVRDDGLADELYIDGFVGVVIGNGVAKINLYVDRPNSATQVMERRIVKRLCVPVPVLISINQTLAQVIERMTKDGLIQAPIASEGKREK